MVAKKRCDFCNKIKTENFSVEKKILDKDLGTILINVAGVEVEKAQLANALACFECSLSLLQAEPIVLKARNLLTRLAKTKVKKPKPHTDQHESNVQSTLLANEDMTTDGITNSEQPSTLEKTDNIANGTPKKVAARRKSVSNKLVASFINDELDGTPVASSTIAGSIASNAKKPKKALADSKAKNGENKIKKTPAKRKKPVEQSATPNVQKENGENLFKKFKEPSDGLTAPKKKKSQGSNDVAAVSTTSNSLADFENHDSEEIVFRECGNCGKGFHLLEKFEAHVYGEKCKLAEIPCQYANCTRRFNKTKKMQEHMLRRHADMQNAIVVE